MKHEIGFVIKNNESLAESNIENEHETKLNNYCENMCIETIFMNTEKNTKNSKTNEPRKFVLNLSHRLDLRSANI